jgi:hypothetical protein
MKKENMVKNLNPLKLLPPEVTIASLEVIYIVSVYLISRTAG